MIKIKDPNTLNIESLQKPRTYFCPVCRRWYNQDEVHSLKEVYAIVCKAGHRVHQMY